MTFTVAENVFVRGKDLQSVIQHFKEEQQGSQPIMYNLFYFQIKCCLQLTNLNFKLFTPSPLSMKCQWASYLILYYKLSK